MQLDLSIKRAIRSGIGDELAQQGESCEKLVVLDADLSGSTKTSVFAKKYPERFFNAGIAEQNMMTTAVGLSLTNKIPVVASFAVFATGRTYDQIRNSICYQKANVKIIGAHGGITVGEDGASHQALEDVSLMRNLPNMTVICPADYNQARQAIKYAIKHQGPVYIRSSRISVPDIYDDSYVFDFNKAITLTEGSDVTILANGDILYEVIEAVNILSKNGINAELINVPVIKPFDFQTILKSVKKTGCIVTVENHSVIGGLGSAVAEILSENYPTKLLRIGVNDEFGQSGKPSELLEYYGLDAKSIANRIKELKK